MKQYITILLLLFSFTAIAETTNWQLKKESDGIKIYLGTVPNSNLKSVKVEVTLNGTISQLVGLLQDAKAHEQWVYNTKASYLIKKITEQEQIYYSEISMPWPITNRDVVMDIKMSQDAATHTLHIDAESVAGYLPAKNGIIRISSSKAVWTVTPIGNGKLQLEYTAQADPAGSIPNWVVNMFSDKGPYETFKKLKDMLAAGAYKNAHFDFIKE